MFLELLDNILFCRFHFYCHLFSIPPGIRVLAQLVFDLCRHSVTFIILPSFFCVSCDQIEVSSLPNSSLFLSFHLRQPVYLLLFCKGPLEILFPHRWHFGVSSEKSLQTTGRKIMNNGLGLTHTMKNCLQWFLKLNNFRAGASF